MPSVHEGVAADLKNTGAARACLPPLAPPRLFRVHVGSSLNVCLAVSHAVSLSFRLPRPFRANVSQRARGQFAPNVGVYVLYTCEPPSGEPVGRWSFR